MAKLLKFIGAQPKVIVARAYVCWHSGVVGKEVEGAEPVTATAPSRTLVSTEREPACTRTRERERGREGERGGERERGRER